LNPIVSTRAYLSSAQARHVAESWPPESKTKADVCISSSIGRATFFPHLLFGGSDQMIGQDVDMLGCILEEIPN
jgi:hypothetical protein